MPRRPTEPRYFASRGGYYVQLGGKQHLLAQGPDDDAEVKERAWRQFYALMAAADVATDGDDSPVKAVLENYLQWVRANKAASTLRIRRDYLQDFATVHGTVRVRDLKKFHLEGWLLDRQRPRYNSRRRRQEYWGPTSRRMAAESVVGALNWAVEQGYLSKNPVASFQPPPPVSRSSFCLVTPEQHRLLLEMADRRQAKGFAHYLTAMYATGARPGELLTIEARHYDIVQGAWVIEGNDAERGRNKLAYRGKRRVVYIPAGLRPLIEELNARSPIGPIFRNERGGRFTYQFAADRFLLMRKNINRRFRAEGKPEPFPKEVSLYGYRHRFAVHFLNNRGSVVHLAALMGTSVAKIEKHYGHVDKQTDALRQALEDFGRPANPR